MQHVHALVRLAVLLARLARELDAARHEEGAPGRGIHHLDEALCKCTNIRVSQKKQMFNWARRTYRIEVDSRGQRGDGHGRGRADGEEPYILQKRALNLHKKRALHFPKEETHFPFPFLGK